MDLTYFINPDLTAEIKTDDPSIVVLRPSETLHKKTFNARRMLWRINSFTASGAHERHFFERHIGSILFLQERIFRAQQAHV